MDRVLDGMVRMLSEAASSSMEIKARSEVVFQKPRAPVPMHIRTLQGARPLINPMGNLPNNLTCPHVNEYFVLDREMCNWESTMKIKLQPRVETRDICG